MKQSIFRAIFAKNQTIIYIFVNSGTRQIDFRDAASAFITQETDET